MARLLPILLAGSLWMAALGPISAGAEKSAVRRDFERLVSPRSLVLLTTGAGLTAIVHPWDDDLQGKRADHPFLVGLFAADNLWASSEFVLPVVLGAWTAARVARCSAVQATSAEGLRGLALAQAVVLPLKVGIGRRRPDGSDSRSFPSGHVANAFALATVLSRRWGAWAGFPLYALAATVPAARIHAGRHYLSDGVAGAAIGIAAGWAVNRPEAPTSRVTWYPLWREGCWWLKVEWRLTGGQRSPY